MRAVVRWEVGGIAEVRLQFRIARVRRRRVTRVAGAYRRLAARRRAVTRAARDGSCWIGVRHTTQHLRARVGILCCACVRGGVLT